MKKILIAEDDFFIRDVYMEIFQNNGYEVEIAVDGEDALVKIKSKLFDMILLDIMMPKASGMDILSQTRKIETPNKITPIFMVTNLSEQNIIEEAFKFGTDGYIIKSQYTPQQVVDEINNFLAGKENLPPQSKT
ncbi:response regulator [Patescibacteria group bacterium]|nr:response regulator [Patescibacteria group bacterium]